MPSGWPNPPSPLFCSQASERGVHHRRHPADPQAEAAGDPGYTAAVGHDQVPSGARAGHQGQHPVHRQGEVHGDEEDLPQHPMHGHLPLSLPPPCTPTPPCSTHTPYIAQNLQRQKNKNKRKCHFSPSPPIMEKNNNMCIYIYVKSQNKCAQTRDLGARSLLCNRPYDGAQGGDRL